MTAREWLEKAKREKFAIGAFNVGNLETFKAIVYGAAAKKSPVIIESSPGETKWMEADNIVDLAKNYSQELGIPILVNLDHALTFEECEEGIAAGYDLIHFDGSLLPFDENIQIAKKVVEEAHQKNLIVEGEIDHIVGSSEMHKGSAITEMKHVAMTDPEKAKEFINATHIDIFAAFFGNVHGIFSEGGEKLDLELLQKIADATGCFLSLHGGSGIPDTQVQEAIKKGIVKVNINTEMRQAYRETLEEVLDKNPDEIAMYKIEEPVIDKIQKIVEQKIEVFGSANKI